MNSPPTVQADLRLVVSVFVKIADATVPNADALLRACQKMAARDLGHFIQWAGNSSVVSVELADGRPLFAPQTPGEAAQTANAEQPDTQADRQAEGQQDAPCCRRPASDLFSQRVFVR